MKQAKKAYSEAFPTKYVNEPKKLCKELYRIVGDNKNDIVVPLCLLVIHWMNTVLISVVVSQNPWLGWSRWTLNVIMGAIASQITSLTIVYSTVYSDTDQRKHQSSAWLAFVRGIHRRLVNCPHKCPVTRKIFPFDDVIMIPSHFNQSMCPACWIKWNLYLMIITLMCWIWTQHLLNMAFHYSRHLLLNYWICHWVVVCFQMTGNSLELLQYIWGKVQRLINPASDLYQLLDALSW